LPYPLCARLLPRLACALNMRLFVHFVQTVQARQCWRCVAKTMFQKLCKFVRFFAHIALSISFLVMY
ncbi:hypothetical protein, partial [Klebsiella michiganensis]|uniref:hypothetical protein n=1 Tax=Klebsiella michiganensis TaxID=1134687 RepID=UPI001C812AB9